MVDAVCTENQKAWEKVTSPHSSEQMHSGGIVKYCNAGSRGWSTQFLSVQMPHTDTRPWRSIQAFLQNFME